MTPNRSVVVPNLGTGLVNALDTAAKLARSGFNSGVPPFTGGTFKAAVKRLSTAIGATQGVHRPHWHGPNGTSYEALGWVEVAEHDLTLLREAERAIDRDAWPEVVRLHYLLEAGAPFARAPP